MCVCVVIPFILNVRLRLVDVPKGVTQEEAHTGFLHLPSVVVLALIFLARRIQPFLSLVDREVEFRIIMCTRRYFQHAHFIPIVGVEKRGEY